MATPTGTIPMSKESAAAGGYDQVTLLGNVERSGNNLTFGASATQAEQETGTSTTVVVTPGRQQFHKSAAKGWTSFNLSSGSPVTNDSYNLNGYTDNGVGDITVNWETDFSSANHAALASAGDATPGNARIVQLVSKAAGSTRIVASNQAATAVDASIIDVAVFGDQ